MMQIMKNRYITLLALILIGSASFGQTGKQKRAERQFTSFSFVKAIETYEKFIDTSFNENYALRKLADSYIMLRQPEKALPIYKRVVEQPNVPSEYYLYYAQALRANGDYKESKVWMRKYRDSGNDTDSRVKEFFKNDDLASAIFNASEKNTIEKTNMNSKYNDFSAVEKNGQIVFVSARDEGVSTKRLYAWDEQPMLDVYVVDSEKQNADHTNKISGKINTIHHDGPITFNKAGDRIYFSRNNLEGGQKVKDSKGIMHIGIYTAELVNGVWDNVQSTSLNNPNYIVYHPSLSADGKHLYFASDMPGGIGGTDIYVADVSESGSLSNVRNLGPVVNTEGNESFPFIHDSGNLYFSSDGHVGLGLMDVFVTVKDEADQIVNIINLGEPINSKRDDFAYFLKEDGFEGYVSSNRKGGVGGDDIYKFNRIPPLMMKGQIFDAVTQEPVEGARVALTRANGEEIAYFNTGADGAYEHLIPRDADFVLKGSKEKYYDVAKDFTSKNLGKQTELIINLDVKLIPLKIENLDPIYFDLDKSFIRPDAAEVLDVVVGIMNKYPSMVIRMESHTDSRADDDYNIALSQRRAKATYEYIIGAGIDPSRITSYEGKGETELVNKCSNGVKCSEDEHQMNRRTEFFILKME